MGRDNVSITFRATQGLRAAVSLKNDKAHVLRFFDELDQSKRAMRPESLVVNWTNAGADVVQAECSIVANDLIALAKAPRAGGNAPRRAGCQGTRSRSVAAPEYSQVDANR